MLRAEIICNQSIEDDVIELLEQELPQICYTVLPSVQGRGKESKKLGDTLWPEQNFCLFTYVDEESAKKIKAIVNTLKNKFPSEGLKLFFCQAVEI